ncbi:MAG: hypothetical protein KGL39_10210 [Patescibacteria group bacterium]|nr:hypothetical protein [Patescibacteria group bacterium]
MKQLSNPKVAMSTDGKQATVVFDVADTVFDRRFVQQVTVGHINPSNPAWSRHAQLSHDSVFLTAYGDGISIKIDDLAVIASKIEPKSTYPPKFTKTNALSVEVSSELNPDFQWEVGDFVKGVEIRPKVFQDQIHNWRKIDGATSKTLDKSLVKSGQFVRCVASSAAGSMTSNPIKAP